MSNSAHHVDILVGRRLRELRARRNMTQKDLASLIGVTYQQLQKYETAQNRISAGRLSDIADQLNVPVDFFFESKNAVSEEDKQTNRLISLWGKLSPEQKTLILGLIESFRKDSRS